VTSPVHNERSIADALVGAYAQASNIGAGRTVAGTVNALVAAYLDPLSSSPFKTGAPEIQRTRRNILENFRKAYGDKPLFRTDNSGRRTMLLTREHMQRITNEKASKPQSQRNFLNTLRAMFTWAAKEGRVPDNPTLGVTREKIKTTGYKTWTEADIERFEAAYPIGTKAQGICTREQGIQTGKFQIDFRITFSEETPSSCLSVLS
jgi:hypothetical protein